MEKEEYKLMYGIEERHWWYKGMRRIICDLIKKYVYCGKKLVILDAGCGTGINMEWLAKYGEVYGVDISEDALKFCKKRKLERVEKTSIEQLPFKDDTFDLVLSLDVIYHLDVKDDIAALKEMKRVLRNEGVMILKVPAGKQSFSEHDKKVYTRERYNRGILMKRLVTAGFAVLKLSYCNFFLFPVVIGVRAFSKKRREMKNYNRFINDLLTSFLVLESKLLNYINLPYGTSLVAVCKKSKIV